MMSLKLVLLAGIVITFGNPAWAGTTNTTIQREPARALGGEVQPSITLFSRDNDSNSVQTLDLELQMSGKRPLSATANPDVWESELLDDQRRTDPGFFTITTD